MQINLLVKPVAEIAVSGHLIHLFPPNIAMVGDYCGISDQYTTAEKIRKLLPFVASLKVPESFRDEREPLPDELVAALSDSELEQIAGIYVGIPAFDKVRTGSDGNSALNLAQAGCATEFLDRLLRAEADRQRRIFERLNAL